MDATDGKRNLIFRNEIINSQQGHNLPTEPKLFLDLSQATYRHRRFIFEIVNKTNKNHAKQTCFCRFPRLQKARAQAEKTLWPPSISNQNNIRLLATSRTCSIVRVSQQFAKKLPMVRLPWSYSITAATTGTGLV